MGKGIWFGRKGDERLPKVLYSSCNEDLDTELVGLEIDSQDQVLVISGGGGRAIGLLLGDPARVVAVDHSEAQCHMLELKKAAFLALSYSQLIEFLGLHAGSGERRLELWPCVEAALPGKAREFWRRQLDIVAEGVLFGGTYERRLRRIARHVQFAFGKELAALFSCRTLDEQQRVWRSLQSNKALLWFFRLWTHPFWYWIYFRHYGWLRRVPEKSNVMHLAKKSINHFMNLHLARESHILQLKLYGSYLGDGVLPHYLRPEHYESIRARLGRLEIACASLVDFLEASKNKFSKFSLSNVTNYLFPEEVARLWQALVKVSRPGARVVYRQVYFDQWLSFPLPDAVRRLVEVETAMREIDKSWIYEISAFEITSHYTAEQATP